MSLTRKFGWFIGLAWFAIGATIIYATVPDPSAYFFGMGVCFVGVLFVSVTEIAHYAFLSVGGY